MIKGYKKVTQETTNFAKRKKKCYNKIRLEKSHIGKDLPENLLGRTIRNMGMESVNIVKPKAEPKTGNKIDKETRYGRRK